MQRLGSTVLYKAEFHNHVTDTRVILQLTEMPNDSSVTQMSTGVPNVDLEKDEVHVKIPSKELTVLEDSVRDSALEPVSNLHPIFEDIFTTFGWS